MIDEQVGYDEFFPFFPKIVAKHSPNLRDGAERLEQLHEAGRAAQAPRRERPTM